MRLVDQLALRSPWNARHREPWGFPIERPDEAPRLRARIGRDPGPRWNLVARRNVHAAAAAVETPVVVGAADLPTHHLTYRQVGAQVGAVRALHQRLPGLVPVEDHPRAQEIPAHDLAAAQLARQRQREPGLMKAGRRAVLLLRQSLGCAHMRLLPVTDLWAFR